MELATLVRKYLKQQQVMQLATALNNQPWVCNVHYVADENNCIYWVSGSTRRHSQEIAKNPKAALGFMVKGPSHPVVGVQVEGDAEVVSDKAERQKVMGLYNERFKVSKGFFDGVVEGTAKELLYRITPRVIVIFDEENFPNNPRQEWPVE